MALAVASRAVSPAHALARPVILWHLLSLDAPTVATLWVAAIGHSAHVFLPAASLASMFLGVWILYAADRLLDSAVVGSDGESSLEPRHHFHARHRAPFRIMLIAASLALAPLLLLMPAASIHLYLLLGTFLFAWLLLVHLPTPRQQARRLPKEFAVGPFFAAATFIPTVARAPALRLHLLPQAILFAALCSLNCLLIYAWEHPGPHTRAAAHASTRIALDHLGTLCFLLLAAAFTLALAERSPLPLAIALSAALLLVLDRHPPQNSTLLRAAADLALLTPVLFL